MSEDDAPTDEQGETGEPRAAAEPWVTGPPVAAQRVPGIDETPETTYVEPQAKKNRRAMLIGLAIGLGVVAVFAAIVSANSGDDSKESTVGRDKRSTHTSSTTSTTTTTAPTSDSSTTSVPAAAPVVSPSTTATTATPPPTPRATADPAAPVYVPAPLPAGVSGTLGACSWQQTNGGQYEASGTLTNGPSTTHGWTITIHWLQNNREIAQQSGVVDLGAGQSQPWSLKLGSPSPPADPFSSALSAA